MQAESEAAAAEVEARIADSVTAIEEAAQEAASDTTTMTEEAGADLATIFSVEGFDFDAAMAAIDASNLSTLGRNSARRVLEAARTTPELLPGALTQVRALLNL